MVAKGSRIHGVFPRHTAKNMTNGIIRPPVHHITDVALMLDCFARAPDTMIPPWNERPRHFSDDVPIHEDLFIGPLEELRQRQ